MQQCWCIYLSTATDILTQWIRFHHEKPTGAQRIRNSFLFTKKKKKFSRVRHWTQFWPRQMHVTTLQPSSSQYILLLLLLLVLLLLLRSRLYVVNALFLSGLLINVLYAYLISSKWYTRPAKLCLIVIVLIGKILMLLRTSFSPFAKTQCSTQHIILRRFQYLSYWGLETKCHTRLSQQEKLQFAIF